VLTTKIDLRDVQGNTLRPYAMNAATFLFIHFDDAAAGRTWLAELAGSVTSAEPRAPDDAKRPTLNLAFTSAGLAALGLPDDRLATFSQEFQDGMAARAQQLGDTGTNCPDHWEPWWKDRQVHAMVAVHAQCPEQVTERLGPVEAGMPGFGIRTVGQHDASRIVTDDKQVKEHFGFTDGFGQPALDIEGYPRPFRGQGTPDGRGAWAPVALGEFVLGQADEQGVLPEAPRPPELAANGTYLVYRKLQQHVGEFRNYVAAQAARLNWPPGKVAACLIGRWPDGSPLVLRPDGPDAALGGDEGRNNDFLYLRDDPDGHRCPIGAHIRRVNPRDTLTLGRERSARQLQSRHRMLRRSITYGPPLREDEPDVDSDVRGLLFMACVADLHRQFEFVQSQWLNDGNILHLGDDRDPLAGYHDKTGKMTIQGSPPRFLPGIPEFVTTRGGEYFFKPGIAALRWLGNLRT
jgi:Dyp-type peroxidase family